MNVAIIIPAFNEEARLPAVLDALHRDKALWDELIVVDDGSTDGTPTAGAERATVISLPENRGKGAAMRAGALAASCEVLCFLDADLRGLEPEHLAQLAEPVLRGEAEMTIGLFTGGRGFTDLSHKVAPWVSGQRAIRRSLFLALSGVEETRQGVEALLTRGARQGGWRVREVAWRGVTHAMKEEKLGVARGAWSRLRMYAEILHELVAGAGSRLTREEPARRRAPE